MGKALLTGLLLAVVSTAFAGELHCTRYDTEVVCDTREGGRYEGWVALDGSVVLRRLEDEVLEGRIRGRHLVLRGPGVSLTCWITEDGRRWHCRP